MIFIVTHTHTPDLCPSGDPEKEKSTVELVSQDSHARESKVKVSGSYIAPPEHTLYFILEADNYEAIVQFLRPLIKIGTPRIVPVIPPEVRCGNTQISCLRCIRIDQYKPGRSMLSPISETSPNIAVLIVSRRFLLCVRLR